MGAREQEALDDLVGFEFWRQVSGFQSRAGVSCHTAPFGVVEQPGGSWGAARQYVRCCALLTNFCNLFGVACCCGGDKQHVEDQSSPHGLQLLTRGTATCQLAQLASIYVSIVTCSVHHELRVTAAVRLRLSQLAPQQQELSH